MKSVACRLLAALWACAAGNVAAGQAEVAPTATVAEATAPALIVGVKVAPPFVIEADGHYRGLAIELWQEAASDHQWHYVYKPYDLDGLLDAVATGEVDVGLGAITATAEREQRMDFAHPITSSGLGVAVRGDANAGWLAVARALVSPAFLKVIGVLTLLLFVVGFLVWLSEHRKNPEQFGGSRAQGLFSGFWWAMVTMTTVGYGDVAPRSVPGRLLGLAWMLTALVVVSFFTASITSALTVGQLSNRIRNAGDLAGVSIASVPGSTSAGWLDRQHREFIHADDLDAALAALAAGRVDAVVYDAPLLRWKIRQHYEGKLAVLPFTLERQDYAFALPNQSPLREAIDTSLLKRINAPDWTTRLARYFGTTP